MLGLKDGKKRFADTALAMGHAFTLCCTLDEAKAVREEVAFFQGVKVLLTKRETSARKQTDEARELAIHQIISSAVVSDQVVDIFDAVGLDNPDIGILDDAFLADVVKCYQNRSIEAAQVMGELVEMAKQFRIAAGRGEQLGLSEDEVRFYDALANNESERAGQAAADGQAHPAQVQVPAGPAGHRRGAGAAAGTGAGRGHGRGLELAISLLPVLQSSTGSMEPPGLQ